MGSSSSNIPTPSPSPQYGRSSPEVCNDVVLPTPSEIDASPLEEINEKDLRRSMREHRRKIFYGEKTRGGKPYICTLYDRESILSYMKLTHDVGTLYCAPRPKSATQWHRTCDNTFYMEKGDVVPVIQLPDPLGYLETVTSYTSHTKGKHLPPKVNNGDYYDDYTKKRISSLWKRKNAHKSYRRWKDDDFSLV